MRYIKIYENFQKILKNISNYKFEEISVTNYKKLFLEGGNGSEWKEIEINKIIKFIGNLEIKYEFLTSANKKHIDFEFSIDNIKYKLTITNLKNEYFIAKFETGIGIGNVHPAFHNAIKVLTMSNSKSRYFECNEMETLLNLIYYIISNIKARKPYSKFSLREKLIQDIFNINQLNISILKISEPWKFSIVQNLIDKVNKERNCNISIINNQFEFEFERKFNDSEEFSKFCIKSINFDELDDW